MTVKPRSNGYQVDVQHKGKRVRAQAPDRTSALAMEAQIKADLLAGREPAVQKRAFDRLHSGNGNSLSTLFDACFSRYWQKAEHRAGVMSVAKVILSHFGKERLAADITTADVEHFTVTQQAQGFAPATINKRLAMLSKMFRYAERKDIIAKRPDIEFLRVRTTRTRFFTDTERGTIAGFYNNTNRQQWADFFVVLLDTGARCSEVRKAKASDITLTDDAPLLHLWDTKSDTPRSIPLTNRAFAAFSRQGNFEFATSNRIEDRWNEIKVALGLQEDDEFVPHACRHDCATRLLKETKNIALVQKWLGHRRIEETMRYSHLVPTELILARDLLEAA